MIPPAGAMGAQKPAPPQPAAAAAAAAAAPARLETINACPDCYQIKDEGDKRSSGNANEMDLDSGYAWLILLIMFLLQSSISGSSRVYGIAYAREVAVGYYDREQASWPIATASAVENLAGILTPALAQFLSWRQMELISTGLFITANLLAYYSQSLALDIVALGLIQGLALSTCTVLSLVINNDYFERYRTTAYGIQMSGSTFGVLYLSPLVTWILETHADSQTNFRLVYLALACVFCVNLLLVLFIRPRVRPVALVANLDAQRSGQEEAKMPHQQLNCNDQDETGQGGFGVVASRKVSRFESHFERKSSIASVSYRARSRRQSILSRAATASGSGLAAPLVAPSSEPPAEYQCALDSEIAQLAKSKSSGIELARANSRAHEPLVSRESLMKKISLCSMRHDPDPSHHPGHHPNQTQQKPQQHQQQQQHHQRPSVVSSGTCEPEVGALPISRQGSLSNTHGQSRKTTQPFYMDPNVGSLASPNTTTYRPELVELDLSLFKKLALESEARELAEREAQQLCTKHMELNRQAQEQKFSWHLVKSLLALPYLHCTWIMLALYYLIARILIIILVDFAHDHGHSLADSTDLLNYWSLGELIGRVFLGSLIDLKFLSCKSCIALTCTLVGALLALMVLVQSYIIYATCSLLIAALISLEYMLINVMMVEYLGKHRVTSCYSLAACLSSAVLFARPSMIGLFRDQLGTYDGLLLLLAGLAVSFALLFYLLEPLLVRRWPKCAA